ncbi:hypothetical protein BCR41DRAFT_353416 [Lobosporangium transversale]|uniref:ADF-H domain-containing protein n=1 Tax=Lobosporangium transversale TaxID=64571 RepID=A0A1Y2GQ32_9FUNG|nr:hypothetical protein BCR41DRAFT_353416 [Lobosporangium transversale]ORZ16034.1 hypothetical protein BCR41DRAFT_353416 [Lobosporangium transversale]|eukprot:XP_021881381.1 hypothetical protein BCR41DRAFT_353416 [Lobosporangium transversale]
MSLQVNFTTYGHDLKAAYDTILTGDPKTSDNWALFGYDKGTNDLKVLGQGKGGLEELEGEFMDGKIQYAFVRVVDPYSQLNKFVLIAWCGDGVPVFKKGLFSSHLADVANFLKGYHLQINARCEDDVAPSHIMKRLDESSGSKYSIHKEDYKPEKITPLQSAYKKTEIPDISAMQRNPTKPQPAPKYGLAATKTFGSSSPSTPSTPQVSKPAPPAPERTWKTSVGSSSYTGGTKTISFNKVTPPSSLTNYGRPAGAGAGASSGTGAPTIPTPTRNEPSMNKAQQIRLEREAREKEERERIKREIEAREAKERQALGQSNAQKQAEEKRLQEQQQQRAQQEIQERAREERAAREREERERAEAEEAARSAREAAKAREQAQVREQAAAQEEEKRRQREKEEREAAERRLREQREEEEAAEKRRTAAAAMGVGAAAAATVAAVGVGAVAAIGVGAAATAAAAAAAAATATATANASDYSAHQEAEDTHGDESAPADAGQGVQAVVLYDYEKTEENEMTLIEGEILVNVQELDPGWWSGESADGTRSGLFPANYVEVIGQDSAAAEGTSAHYAEEQEAYAHDTYAGDESGLAAVDEVLSAKPTAVALYDYNAGEPNEISFSEGDIIRDIEFVSDDWWSGLAQDGTNGLFPSNYVELQE